MTGVAGVPRAGVAAGAVLAAIAVVAAAVLAVTWPLATYALSLAVLGLPHVLAELRYVDARFGPRLGGRLRRALLGLLAAVVLVRLAGLLGLAPPAALRPLELLLVAALAASALPALARRGTARLALGLAVTGALVVGALDAPAVALVVLAVVHNLTPVGFLAERLRGAARRRALLAAALVFGAVPLTIALGAWHRLPLPVSPDAAALLPTGPLERHIGVFVPAAWSSGEGALRLFSAAVFLQLAHYAAVLHVLPRLDDAGTWSPAGSLVRWPGPRGVLLVMVAVSAPLLAAFALDFVAARGVYGLAAAVHAWLEVPLLLLALAGPDAVGLQSTRE